MRSCTRCFRGILGGGVGGIFDRPVRVYIEISPPFRRGLSADEHRGVFFDRLAKGR